MNLIEQIVSKLGVTTFIPSPKGIVIPAVDVVASKVTVALLEPLMPVGFVVKELKPEFRGETPAIWFGKATADRAKQQTAAQARLDKLLNV